MKRLSILLVILLLITGNSLGRAQAAVSITGLVYHDHNDNGTRDLNPLVNNNGSGQIGLASDEGIAGVTITAYDATGATAGTATSAADGTYSLSASSVGPYRVEFTTLPAGFVSSAHGTSANSSGTNVQFVPATGAANVNFGAHLPQDYCQDNPTLATQCYIFGDNTQDTTSPVFITLPYTAGAASTETNPTLIRNPTAHPITIPASQIGTTAGLAYGRRTGTYYAAAFMKKHTGFSAVANPTGAIYRITSAGTASLFTNLNTLFTPTTAGANPHSLTPCTSSDVYSCDSYNTAWDAVGKVALGGMDTNIAETYLYVMNLADRSLYRLPLTTTPTAANVIRQTVPLNQSTCPNPALDIRPFAVKFDYFGGVERLYVGMVCSAESTGSAANLFGYVYTVDPTTLAFSSTPVFTMSFNYSRRWTDNPASAIWNAWTPVFATVQAGPSGGIYKAIYPQPWITDLAFDRGNLILGIRDRAGDQTGRAAPSDPTNPTRDYYGISAGDTLRAFGNINNGWTLEDNGSGTAGANNNQGPGNGEFYFQDNFGLAGDFHDEVTLGGVAQVPGYPDAVVTTFDPGRALPANVSASGGFGTGGLRWFNNTAGTDTKGYELFNTFIQPKTLNKANGIGLVRAACGLAPIEIGNYLWIDANRNGIQDPDESPAANVLVDLYDATGANLIASSTSDANGRYYFSSQSSPLQPNTGYRIVIRPSNFDPGQPLAGYAPTINLATGSELRDSNGVAGTVLPAFPGGADVVTVTLGDHGFNDHTLDFGFTQPVSATPTATESATPNTTTTPTTPIATSSSIPNTSVPVTPIPTPGTSDLQFSKSSDVTLVRPGETIRFTMTVSNTGSAPILNVIVTDPVPDIFTIESATANQGTYTINGNTVVFNVGTLNAGATATLTIVAKVRPDVQPPVSATNAATVDYSGGTRRSASSPIRITGGALPRTGEHP